MARGRIARVLVGASQEIDRQARRLADNIAQANRISGQGSASVGDRISNPRGATSGGGGRGGFKGTIKDFFQRDEFTGRTGTISRLAMQGNVLGTLLAFQSAEELFRNLVDWAKGDASFRDLLDRQIKFLIPSIIREQLPQLINMGLISLEVGHSYAERLRRDRKAAEEVRKTLNDKSLRLDRFGNAYYFGKPRGYADTEGFSPEYWRSARYLNTEEYGRKLTESSRRPNHGY